MQLLETIRLSEGRLQNIAGHNHRSNAARLTLFGLTEKWDLAQHIEIPQVVQKGLWKCRVLYKNEIENLDFQPYKPKKTNSIQLVDAPGLDYSFKYADRSVLQGFVKNSGADDVLFIKNGLISDLSYANIAFFDGKTWWTPETPLLAGTRRAQLLAAKRIFPKKIKPKDIPSFLAYRPINAMLQFGRTEKCAISIFRFS